MVEKKVDQLVVLMDVILAVQWVDLMVAK